MFKKLAFTASFHKVVFEVSVRKQKFYIIVKKYTNDKYKFHIKELYATQGHKLLSIFDNDFNALIDRSIKVSSRKGVPPVDFSLLDKLLYTQPPQEPPLLSKHHLLNTRTSRNLDDVVAMTTDDI